LDPFGEEEASGEPFYFKRKDIINFNPSQNQDSGGNQQIAEVAKKITEYNAKEKLWLACRNTNLPENMSNDWKLDIDIQKVQEKEEEEYLKMLEVVAKIEKITNATELILQNRSIYSEAYRPKYIEEMNDIEKIKELSQTIQDRLRNVKLAVSKANLNQSKMIDLTKKKNENKSKDNNSTIKNNLGLSQRKFGVKLNPISLSKSKSLADINSNRNSIKKESTIKKDKDNISNNNTSILGDNNINKSNLNNKKSEIIQPENEQFKLNPNDITNISGLKKNLLPKKYEKPLLPEIKSRYAMNKIKLVTPGDMFNKLQGDFDQGFKELFSPLKLLFKKTKEPKKQILRSRSTIVLPGFSNKKAIDYEEEQEKAKNEKKQHKKNISTLEKYLRQLEQYSS
jgi:hypothetical protein